ncbi:hypothetical protein ACFWFU_17645 [Streptomyces sp. NPDC060235]|uniref:hypothetical protein n=1 Tax=unclassified Streptomyces TaxID=2593676 RepID=UPI00364FDE68
MLTAAATRTQRLALRWLTRRPAQHITLAPVPGSLRLSAGAVALLGLIGGLFAIGYGVPVDVVLPAMLLAPILAEHLTGRLDARAGEHVRSVEGEDAVRCMQRLAVLHTSLVRAAASSDRYELRRSAEVGQHLMWDAADLLRTRDPRSASADLVARERLMLQLADQVAQLLKRTTAQDGTAARTRPANPTGLWAPTRPAPGLRFT